MRKEIELFGIKTRIEIIILLLFVGILIGSTILCFCVKSKEGFADIKYRMGETVEGSYDNPDDFSTNYPTKRRTNFSERKYYWY
jgi:hypothetical protein